MLLADIVSAQYNPFGQRGKDDVAQKIGLKFEPFKSRVDAVRTSISDPKRASLLATTSIDHVFNMKRKRPNRSNTGARKRQKTEDTSAPKPSPALLQKYYPTVVSLRQYLASRLSKQRKKRLQQYVHGKGDEVVCKLLDTTLIGTFGHIQVDESSFVEEDLTIFTQQRTQLDSSIALTPGSFKQPEVGHSFLILLSSNMFNALVLARRAHD